MNIVLRPLLPDDYSSAAHIFFRAVHEGTRYVYSSAQRAAWAGASVDLPAWQEKLRCVNGFVAEAEGRPVGFITIDVSGYVDLVFVLPEVTQRGVGTSLLEKAKNWAIDVGASEMSAHASEVARPFLERAGWSVEQEELTSRQGTELRRYRMSRRLR